MLDAFDKLKSGEVEETEESKETEETEASTVAELPPVPKKHVIDILFSFLDTEEELNPVLCGYFCKLIGNMMSNHRKAMSFYVFNPQNKVIERMINHVYNRSIADTLTRFLNQDVLQSEYHEEVFEYIMTTP